MGGFTFSICTSFISLSLCSCLVIHYEFHPLFCVIFVAESINFHFETLTRFLHSFYLERCGVVPDEYTTDSCNHAAHMWRCSGSHVKIRNGPNHRRLFWFEFNHNGQPQYHHLLNIFFEKKMTKRFFKRWATSNKQLSESIIWKRYSNSHLNKCTI